MVLESRETDFSINENVIPLYQNKRFIIHIECKVFHLFGVVVHCQFIFLEAHNFLRSR